MCIRDRSHFAYYVLIRAVVLGERVKIHRRGTAVPYHVPVWDVVHGVDQREEVVAAAAAAEDAGEATNPASSPFSVRMQTLIQDLGTIAAGADPSVPNPSHAALLPACLPAATSHPPLFVLGDSHCLSIAWQTIKIHHASGAGDGGAPPGPPPWLLRTLVPYPATGLKAWHVREGTRFFTHSNLRSCLRRLPPSCRTVLLSAGEIDCREGIGGEKLAGYYASCDEAVRSTVREYVGAAAALAAEHGLQILLLPVAPYTFRNAKKGKAAGRDERRRRILLWNDVLREECRASGPAAGGAGVYLLDYERDLRSPDDGSPVGFVLNKAFNADYTHLNSAFLPHLERAFDVCVREHGCNVELL